MIDREGNEFRWEVKWNPYFRPFFEADSIMDGGSRFWHIGLITIWRRYIYPTELP